MRAVAMLLCLAAAASVGYAADGDSIESVTRAVYEVISGPAGTRDWARFRSLFAEHGQLISIRMTPEGAEPHVMTPDDFAKTAGANFEKQAFYESELTRRVEQFGNIAHVFSTYESRRAPGGKPFARGINSFQLVKSGGTWKVMSLLWDAEREGNPLPSKYLAAPPASNVAGLQPGVVGEP